MGILQGGKDGKLYQWSVVSGQWSEAGFQAPFIGIFNCSTAHLLGPNNFLFGLGGFLLACAARFLGLFCSRRRDDGAADLVAAVPLRL